MAYSSGHRFYQQADLHANPNYRPARRAVPIDTTESPLFLRTDGVPETACFCQFRNQPSPLEHALPDGW